MTSLQHVSALNAGVAGGFWRNEAEDALLSFKQKGDLVAI